MLGPEPVQVVGGPDEPRHPGERVLGARAPGPGPHDSAVGVEVEGRGPVGGAGRPPHAIAPEADGGVAGAVSQRPQREAEVDGSVEDDGE